MLQVARVLRRLGRPWICWEEHSLTCQSHGYTVNHTPPVNMLKLSTPTSAERHAGRVHGPEVKLTSACSSDLKMDRSKVRLLSWMLLVPIGPCVPWI